MPYSISKNAFGKFEVLAPDGKVLGTHATKGGAERQRKAIYANYKEKE